MSTSTPRPLFDLQKSPLPSFSKSHDVSGTSGLDVLGQSPFVPAGNQTQMPLFVVSFVLVNIRTDLFSLIAFVIKIF